MKTKKLSKALLLNKKTVANLNKSSMDELQGGRPLIADPRTTDAAHCSPSLCGCVKSDISYLGYSCDSPYPCAVC